MTNTWKKLLSIAIVMVMVLSMTACGGTIEPAQTTTAAATDSVAVADVDTIPAVSEETAYIGDTGTDMKTGKAYGAALNIGVSWGFRDVSELAANGATHIVNTPAEILALIENANG